MSSQALLPSHVDEVRWYSSFKKRVNGGVGNRRGILDDYTESALREMKIVSVENSKGTYNYSVFRSHVHLLNYIESLEPQMRIMNELVMEYQLQKPRFDIDICSESTMLPSFTDIASLGEYVKDCVIEGVLKELTECSLEKNILVYSSHSAYKASYHIIVDGYLHTSCHDALAFYEKIVPSEVKVYVDDKIYDRNHSLRMLYCRKRIGLRVKIFEQRFTYKGQTVEHVYPQKLTENQRKYYIFAESMITCTSRCALLPAYAKKREMDNEDYLVGDETCMEVMAMVKKKLGDVYTFEQCNGRFINLRRNKTDYCTLCNRNHDPNTIPFVYIVGSSAYWTCGRSEKNEEGKKGKIYLGELTTLLTYMSKNVTNIIEEEDDEECGELSSQLEDMMRELSIAPPSTSRTPVPIVVPTPSAPIPFSQRPTPSAPIPFSQRPTLSAPIPFSQRPTTTTTTPSVPVPFPVTSSTPPSVPVPIPNPLLARVQSTPIPFAASPIHHLKHTNNIRYNMRKIASTERRTGK